MPAEVKLVASAMALALSLAATPVAAADRNRAVDRTAYDRFLGFSPSRFKNSPHNSFDIPMIAP